MLQLVVRTLAPTNISFQVGLLASALAPTNLCNRGLGSSLCSPRGLVSLSSYSLPLAFQFRAVLGACQLQNFRLILLPSQSLQNTTLLNFITSLQLGAQTKNYLLVSPTQLINTPILNLSINLLYQNSYSIYSLSIYKYCQIYNYIS